MEQMNNTLLSMLQTMTNPNDVMKTGGKDSGNGDFQKLLDQKTQSSKPENSGTKGEQKEPVKGNDTPAADKKDAPIQEDAQTVAKRLMQSGLVMVDPASIVVPQAEMPVMAEGEAEQMPLLDAAMTQQITDPAAVTEDPAQMLDQQFQGQAQPQTQEEGMVQTQVQTQQTGEVEVQAEQKQTQTVQTTQPQEQAVQDEGEVEVTDAEQAPQRVFQEVEAAPIKVGDTYQMEEPDVAKQIDTQLTQALAKGESMVRVQLNPEALGTVTVEVRQDVEGILRIVLTAHSSETRGLLERHAANLQNMLANRGQTAQVEVQRQEESQQGQDHSYDGHNGSNAQSQEERRQRQERQQQQTVDFAQQLRLGLIPEE